MWTTDRGTAFTVIGEDIHATRVVLRSGKFAARTADGREAVRFIDETGAPRLLPIPQAVQEGTDFGGGRIKQVKAAIMGAMAGADEAEAGVAYLRALALRQQAAGADYLDLNVDEVTTDPEGQCAAMQWLVRLVEPMVSIPLALDSSSPAVISAGLGALSPGSRPLLNSASLERLDVLDLAAASGCPVVVSAAGRSSMPSSAEERVANASEAVAAAVARGLTLDALYLDALVLPVGVDPEAGGQFLEALGRLREAFGARVHLTGGFSNVSFGLPNRRLLNDVFLALAADAGADSGILDPLGVEPATVFVMERESRAWRLAADLLTGRDPYGMEFLVAVRSGELAAASA